MTRRKTTIYVDESLLRLAKVAAARSGKREYQIVEEALRSYLGLAAVERAWSRSSLSEEDALTLAYEELHRARG